MIQWHFAMDLCSSLLSLTIFTARETRSLNVAVAALMELSNFLRSHQSSKGNSVQMLDSIRMLLVMLYPIAPHMASELWSGLQHLPSTFGKANVREIVGFFTFALKTQLKSIRTADIAVPTSYPYTFDNQILIRTLIPIIPSHPPEFSRPAALATAQLSNSRCIHHDPRHSDWGPCTRKNHSERRAGHRC